MKGRAFLLAVVAYVGSVSCGPWEPFQRLEYRVVDAEYSRSQQRVVLVSAAPAALHLYDPLSHLDRDVALSADPTCVGLSPDGNFAAVGHDRLISYVDLSAGTVVRTFPVSAGLSDLVVPGNGRLYGLRNTPGTSPGFSVVDIASGVEQIVGDGGTRGKQRPGTQSLYLINARVIPENHTSYDLSGGTPSFLHRSPNTDPYCRDLWFSEDGLRIFTACGESLRASSGRDQDMRFTGRLSHTGEVQSLSHVATAHHVIAIPRPVFGFPGDPLADGRLDLYHDAYLEYRGSLELPPFVVNGQAVAAHGRFVFFDEGLGQFIVIQQADSSAGLQHDFGIFALAFHPGLFQGASGPTPPPAQVQSFPTFDRPIEDAKYDAALDRVVFVSSDPHLLHVLDPESGEDRQVSLPFAPNSVSIAPAGDRAAVGHDRGHISLVDLPSATLVATYPANGDVLSVVLTSDRVFEFPRHNPGWNLTSTELSTGVRETSNISVGSDSRAALDSTGSFIYEAEGYFSPLSSLGKYDISRHPAAYMFIPPARHCTGVWPSKDGHRVFTRCGSVYRSTADPWTNMTVEGTLPETSPVRHLDDSNAAARIAVIRGIPDYDGFGFAVVPGDGWNGDRSADTRVKLFDLPTLSFQRDVPLLPFTLGSSIAPARGRFVFFNRLGTRAYVIVEADSASGLANGFGIQSFDVQ